MLQKNIYLLKKLADNTPQKNKENFAGFTLVDEKLGCIGEILFVNDFNGNIVFTINYNNKEIFYPYIEKNISHIDYSKKTINVTKSPEGIFEI